MPRKSKQVKESYEERFERLNRENRGEIVERTEVVEGATRKIIATYENGEQKVIAEYVGNIRI